MREIAFSVPVSGTIKIDEQTITVTINRAETSISFDPEEMKKRRVSLAKGKTVYDVLLEAALVIVGNSAEKRFSGADLYHKALEKYPYLKRSTWNSHVIASAPDHPSNRHHRSHRDYLRYCGRGQYTLNPEYINKK